MCAGFSASGGENGAIAVWNLAADSSPLACSSKAASRILIITGPSVYAGFLASGGEDGAIAVWNLAAAAEGQNVLSTVMRQEEEKGIRMPPQLLFQHFGHRHTVRRVQVSGCRVMHQGRAGLRLFTCSST